MWAKSPWIVQNPAKVGVWRCWKIHLSVWWAVERDIISSVVVLKGRLKKHISVWRDQIRVPTAIINVIETVCYPSSLSLPLVFMQTTIQPIGIPHLFRKVCAELCATGCIVEVSTRPSICSPLSKTGKKRLVGNLRHLNRFCGSKSLSMRTYMYE